MKKTPVHIITGFLGSGKTTAITRLLEKRSPGEKWVVIINEFGRISIDGQTLRSSPDSHKVIEISGGCICCTSKTFFRESLGQVSGSETCDRIIIEPTGLGGVEMVTDIVRDFSGMQLMPVICMVDISTLQHARYRNNLIYKSQIRQAGLIVFSKCDLIKDREELFLKATSFQAEFPGIHFLPPGQILTSLTEGKRSQVGRKKLILSASTPAPDSMKIFYSGFSITSGAENVIDPRLLISIFSNFPEIVRVKGFLRTGSGWKIIHFSLAGWHRQDCPEKDQNEIMIIAEYEPGSAAVDRQEKLRKELEIRIGMTPAGVNGLK